ncbi:xanthine phosphoribosyltransferase [Clostridium pasteurianum]|uniref:Xanthine phosphoribosyltransferase n=1 Tax=Clostridium pasteurianum BC1 TaxID=86416 RepID=R4K0E3_CLOPA|nr:xanthine phosphoribosyltransferase [Clostridium pasteurianum]AGK96547.1 xanthine phosphoribosyltransferase [Clostridium pasteurianum BC1]
MELLKKRILQDGIVIGNRILKVDSFLNHQMDINLFNEMGKEFRNRFKHKNITKILTVEASGIGIACIAAQHFDNIPVIFAKKYNATNLDKDTYEAEVYSFTKEKTYKIRVSKKYINNEDRVLIIDDFLASGSAALGLIDIVRQSGAEASGIGIVIEKSFQGGRKMIEECGVELQSLAIIDSMENNTVNFK